MFLVVEGLLLILFVAFIAEIVVGALLARALVRPAFHVVVRVPRASDGLAGGAPEAEEARRALGRVPQTRAVSHRARTARRRRSGPSGC